MAQLIPGLPDHLARECLIRIPYDLFPTAASVSRNWRKELQSSLFHRLRKAAGLTKWFIAFVISIRTQREPDVKRYYLVLFDPATDTWGKLLPFPYPHLCIFEFVDLVVVGHKLVAIDSWERQPLINSDRVHIYDFATGAWRQGARISIDEETLEVARKKTEELRGGRPHMVCVRGTVLLGATRCGGQLVGYVTDLGARTGERFTWTALELPIWRKMKLPMALSESNLLGTCFIEI